MKRTLLIAGVAVLVVLAFVERGIIRDAYIEWSKPAVPSEQPRPTPRDTAVITTPLFSPTPSPTPITGAVNLAVPFQPQAPRGDWSQPWQDACEEASAILVNAYWSGQTLNADTMEQAILDLIVWENAHFGYYQETTAAQTARMLREVYGYRRVDVISNATIADITRNVRAGRPVIVPLAGQLLENPYYTAPGPIYHMLVVKGVAENGDLITNDVGTRHGYNLTYSPALFLNAMHDAPRGGAAWPADVDPETYIQTGARTIVVVYPN